MSNEVEEIKDKLDIVDYVGRVVQLKKNGVNFKGLCPFHSEKTPSFIVSQDKQIFHCFGCNEGGDIFTWVMKIDGMEFGEALKKLASDAGVTLTRNYNPAQNDRREKLFLTNEETCKFFQKNLQAPIGKKALDYLKKRKLNDKTIKEFRLGYAPGGNALLKKLIAEGYSKADLVNAGVTKIRDSKLVDQFRNRVTFPIINSGGRVVGFSARVLGDALPKYINTPSTDIYDKSAILYGICQAKEAIRKQNHTIIVEGNMDVIASHQAGVKNVVASSGTALTERQLDILKKFSPNIKLAFDIDPAGDLATRRAIEIAFSKGINVKIIVIPEGKDPAEVVAKNAKVWIESVKKAEYVMDYLFNKLFIDENLNDILKKKKATREFLAFIAKIDDFVEKEHYIKKLADKIKVNEDSIRGSLKPKKDNPANQDEKKKTASKNDLRERIEKRILALGLNNPKNLPLIIKELPEEDFKKPETIMLYKKVKNHYNLSKGFDLKSFGKLFSKEEAESMNVLLLKCELETEDLTQGEISDEIFYLVKKIRKLNIQNEKAKLAEDIKKAEARKDNKWEKKLIEKMQLLLKKEQKL